MRRLVVPTRLFERGSRARRFCLESRFIEENIGHSGIADVDKERSLQHEVYDENEVKEALKLQNDVDDSKGKHPNSNSKPRKYQNFEEKSEL